MYRRKYAWPQPSRETHPTFHHTFGASGDSEMRIDVKEFAALFDDTPTDRSSSWKRRSGFVGKLQEYLKSSKIPWSCKNWHLGNIHRWTNPAVDVGVQCEQCIRNSRERLLSEIGRPTPQNLHMALGCYIGEIFPPHQEFRSCGPFAFRCPMTASLWSNNFPASQSNEQ